MDYRTDLAIENVEMYDQKRGKTGDIDGVFMEKIDYGEDIRATRIKILNQQGEKALQKPAGNYITIEIDGLIDGQEELKVRAGKALGEELKKLINFHYFLKVLVIGLGNDRVTPDALGPYTVSKVKVTRHLFIIYEAEGDEEMSCVSGFIPGVTGSTGMETAELIKQAAEISNPEVILVVDSLAAKNIERISTTIQINDTGISPGSGMGNQRTILNEQTLGRRVISVGVPTVIDSSTLIMDALQGYITKPREVEDYIEQNGQNMIVTSTDIDQVIKDFSDIISNGINITLHPGIYS
ncbi:GPR endopeptidase [Clostridium aminobutyricum]|uniref:Germination protease n=1 Tax=Clostridium aminobutyricum TaxID=33953 RepID=A0A939D715_CLOAM|nr:GPR endopeptidase [Clostridium aminobutyricum]MBN7772250.1 GPR endopeptidase [Clostridium aminobutyricum]